LRFVLLGVCRGIMSGVLGRIRRSSGEGLVRLKTPVTDMCRCGGWATAVKLVRLCGVRRRSICGGMCATELGNSAACELWRVA